MNYVTVFISWKSGHGGSEAAEVQYGWYLKDKGVRR